MRVWAAYDDIKAHLIPQPGREGQWHDIHWTGLDLADVVSLTKDRTIIIGRATRRFAGHLYDALVETFAVLHIRLPERASGQREEEAMATAAAEKKPRPTITAMRAAAQEQGVEQITDWGDPRLVKFWETIHKKAENSSYCGTFDQIMQQIGAPARMTPTYWAHNFTVPATIMGEEVEVEVSMNVYGYEGDLADAMKRFRNTYGQEWNTGLKNAITSAVEREAMRRAKDQVDFTIPTALKKPAAPRKKKVVEGAPDLAPAA